MNSATPPPADDDQAYIFVDHREWLLNIVEGVSRRLTAAHALTAREKGVVVFCGQEHRIPLTMSPHDQYVVTSSLAELLKDHYRFFVLVPSLDTDTHGLLVAPIATAKAWDTMPAHLTPLRLGFDYFHQIRIPYLNHENSAPDFARDSQRLKEAGAVWEKLIEASLFHKAIDPEMASALARLAMQ